MKTGKKKNANSGARKELSAGATTYTGPIVGPRKGLAGDLETIYLSAYNPTLAGSSVGLQVASSTNLVTNSVDWSKWAGLYDEVRVLGFEVDWLPRFPDGNASVSHSEGYVVSTHNPTNPGPFTNVGQMIDYTDCKFINTGKPFKMIWKMNSTEESQFVPTSGTNPAQGWINLWFPYATSTSAYGSLVYRFAAQFRGRI